MEHENLNKGGTVPLPLWIQEICSIVEKVKVDQNMPYKCNDQSIVVFIAFMTTCSIKSVEKFQLTEIEDLNERLHSRNL